MENEIKSLNYWRFTVCVVWRTYQTCMFGRQAMHLNRIATHTFFTPRAFCEQDLQKIQRLKPKTKQNRSKMEKNTNNK